MLPEAAMFPLDVVMHIHQLHRKSALIASNRSNHTTS
jgi:hypothetical protein